MARIQSSQCTFARACTHRRHSQVFIRASVSDALSSQRVRKATLEDVAIIRQRLLDEKMNPLSIKPENITVVDSKSDGVIAFAQLEEIKAAAGAGKDPTYEFRSLVVSPKYRGQGIGSMLMQQIVSACAFDIYLTTLSKTTPFYQKAGFQLLQPAEVPWFLWFEALAGTLVARLAVNDQLVVMHRPKVKAGQKQQQQ